VSGVKGISLEGDAVRCEQEVASGRDVYRLTLPAVIGVKEGLNLPRYPSVPGRLRAKRKPLVSSSPPRPQPRLTKLRLKLPPQAGKQVQILGDGPDAAPAVVAILGELGLL